jgi:hypothetical protein
VFALSIEMRLSLIAFEVLEMSNFWAIAVGINHYQLLQPLHFAQQDAQSLCECVVSDAGFFPENCFLLTDTSPAVSDVSTDPTQENLSHWLTTLEQRVLAEDWVWCFFSGYGICVEGKDYLLPIDADPDKVAETGISARSFFLSLKALPTQNILVLLDIDRAQAGLPEKVGIDVANLAQEFSITTMLSCRPEQSSHEAPALNHGLFTQALIEGLRSHQCSTLAGLESFMKSRLPELCDHNDRPIQDPVLIVTHPDPLYQVIMPVNWAETQNWTPTTANPFAVEGDLYLSPIESDYLAIADTTNFEPQPIMGATAIDMPDTFNLEPESTTATSENLEPEPIPTSIETNHSPVQAPEPASSEVGDQVFWERLLFGGGAFLVVLLLGVLFRNWSALVGGQQASSGGSTQTQSASPAPTTSPTASPSPQSSEQILSEARSLIKPTLASDARRAINRASRIPQTDPLYAEAQKDIDRWSRNILDIAKKRAEQGEFRQAIAAAQLVPNDRGAVSAEAQKSIRQWRQRVR